MGKALKNFTLQVLVLTLLLGNLVLRCECSYASLSLTTDISQPEPAINESYCAIYNPSYTSITAHKADASLFHQVFLLSNSSFSDTLGCEDLAHLVPHLSLVVDRGNCTYYRKALVAQQVNASLLVVVYNETMVTSVPSLDSDGSSGQPISIPVLLVSNDTGKEITSWAESSLVYLSVFIPSSPPVDPGSVILFCIAVGTILGASFLANHPFQFLRYGLLLRKGEETMAREKSKGGQKLPALFLVFGLVVMVGGTCLFLLLLYFFYFPMVYVMLALYSVSSMFGVYFLLSPFVALIPLPHYCRVRPNKLPILKYRPDILFFATVLFSISVVIWWVVERHSSYAWILQDILGFAFIAMLLSRLRFLKIWSVAVLMSLLFVYDIFMVFITPYFTNDGISVMEKAATGPEGGPGSNEILPMVFIVPKLYYPSTLESLCSDYISSRPASLLGYGDVGIPGLLVSMCLRFDLTFRKGKVFKLYYATSGIAYIFGLAITYTALALTQAAQPALLYLVPTTLGSVTLLSLLRKEFTLFFTNKEKKKKKSTKGPSKPAKSDSGGEATDQGKEQDVEEVNIQRTAQDERKALINDTAV